MPIIYHVLTYIEKYITDDVDVLILIFHEEKAKNVAIYLFIHQL